jgi:uncharacterized protein YbjT (DUF2867 family)
MVTILGAGGAISGELVKELTVRNEPVRLVSRNPHLVPRRGVGNRNRSL